ncbi:MAG: FtsX-like permease family protein [Solirubrobacteraceae bacterium]
MLGSTLIRSEQAFRHDLGEIASDDVLLSASADVSSPREPAAVPAQLRARVHALLPGAAQTEISFDEHRGADGSVEGAVVDLPGRDSRGFGVAIGGPELLTLIGATAGRAALDRGEAVALTPGLIEHGRITIKIPQRGRRARQVRLPATEVRADRRAVSVVISPRTAARLGLTATVTDVLFRAPNDLTTDQRHAVQAQAIAADRSAAQQPSTEILFAGKFPRPGIVRGLYEALLAIAAALTLAVVASGLALSAAEGKADDTMLTALGADPRSRRRLRATQAGLLVEIGGLLALPAGLIPAAVIAVNAEELRFAVPWDAVAIVLLALPAAAAAGAWLLTRPGRWAPPGTWAD